jgi:hypothetical protein
MSAPFVRKMNAVLTAPPDHVCKIELNGLSLTTTTGTCNGEAFVATGSTTVDFSKRSIEDARKRRFAITSFLIAMKKKLDSGLFVVSSSSGIKEEDAREAGVFTLLKKHKFRFDVSATTEDPSSTTEDFIPAIPDCFIHLRKNNCVWHVEVHGITITISWGTAGHALRQTMSEFSKKWLSNNTCVCERAIQEAHKKIKDGYSILTSDISRVSAETLEQHLVKLDEEDKKFWQEFRNKEKLRADKENQDLDVLALKQRNMLQLNEWLARADIVGNLLPLQLETLKQMSEMTLLGTILHWTHKLAEIADTLSSQTCETVVPRKQLQIDFEGAQKKQEAALKLLESAKQDLEAKRAADVQAIATVSESRAQVAEAQAKLDKALVEAQATKEARAQARALLETAKQAKDAALADVASAKAAIEKANADEAARRVSSKDASETTSSVPELTPVPPPPPSSSPPPSPSSSTPAHERRKQIPKHVKTLVWNKYVGEEAATAVCTCCRATQISVRNFHCGHVISEAAGGNVTLNNLRPICAACNASMGTRSMNEFTSEFFGWAL